jgi:hypothetical protein
MERPVAHAVTTEQLMEDVVEDELKPFLQGFLMGLEPDPAQMEKVVLAYKLLDAVEKAAKDQKEYYKPFIMTWAEKLGEPTDKGGHKLEVGGCLVIREKRTAKVPEAPSVRKLLEDKGIKIEDAFDKQVTMVLSPTKLQYLIDTGKLKQADVDALRDVNYALRVDASTRLKQLMEDAGQ